MGIPKSFFIVVISNDNAELASVVAAILKDGRGYQSADYAPTIIPTCYIGMTQRWAFTKTGIDHNLRIPEITNSYVIDPRRIDLWLTLDEKVMKYPKRLIEKMGPAPDNYYRKIFPDPVVYCGFSVPFIDKSYPTVSSWFDKLKTLFEPWKKRIWDTFSGSS